MGAERQGRRQGPRDVAYRTQASHPRWHSNHDFQQDAQRGRPFARTCHGGTVPLRLSTSDPSSSSSAPRYARTCHGDTLPRPATSDPSSSSPDFQPNISGTRWRILGRARLFCFFHVGCNYCSKRMVVSMIRTCNVAYDLFI